jgi:hypothetical protein
MNLHDDLIKFELHLFFLIYVKMERSKPPPPRLNYLHIFSDRSVLRKMTARDLIKVAIWNGNRILNEEHKKDIASSIQTIRSLDLKPFHLVTYPCEDENGMEEIKTFVVDGQHRVSILKDAFFTNSELENFDVLVVEKSCETQNEVSAYFKLLNTTRSIEWKEDPVLLAAPYVNLFETTFNKNKKDKEKLVRAGATKRPYISIEKLREAITKRIMDVTKRTPEQFVMDAVQKNKELIDKASLSNSNDKSVLRALEIGFMLAIDEKDEKFRWV